VTAVAERARARSGGAEPGTPVVLARAAAAEWVRLRTVRTTWWCLLAAAVTVVGLGALAAADEAAIAEEGGALPATLAGELGILPGQFALLVLALLAVTSEHATGVFGPTLQWTPRRRVLLAARVAVPVAVATVAGVLLALVADVVAWSIAPELTLPAGELAGSLARVAAVLAAGGVLAVGVGLLLRSTAGALATVFLVQLVLPFLLPGFGVEWLADLGELLPGSAAIWTLLGEPDMSAAQATALLVGWSAVALAAGGWSLLRRDAG
jgi:ABC-2 type transport system permease protein